MTTWPRLKPLLITRFSASKTAVQKMRLIASLTQKQTETCQDFWDRVQYALLEFHEKPRENIGGAHAEHMRNGYDRAVATSLAMMFLAGVRPEIRTTLEARMEDDATSDWIRTAAIRAELAMGGPKNAQIAAVGVSVDAAASGGQTSTSFMMPPTQPAFGGGQSFPAPFAHSFGQGSIAAPSHSALAMELASLNARLSQMSAGGKGKGGGAGKANRGPPPPMHERNSWYWCYKCQQHGLHTGKECPRSAAEISQLPKADRRAKPAGPVFDPCFPHLRPNGQAGGSN